MAAVADIAVLASGRGSNLEAIARAIDSGGLRARVAALVCDRPGAPVLEKAARAGIPAKLIEAAPEGDAKSRRRDHDRRILEALQGSGARFLALAGYMRILSPVILDAFDSGRGYSRIVNVHPSLLPAFPGLDAYRRAFEWGSRVTGVTVHLVDRELDHGPICAQEAFSIADCGSAGEVERRGLAIEHRLFPETLDWVLREEFTVEKRGGEGRTCVRAG